MLDHVQTKLSSSALYQEEVTVFYREGKSIFWTDYNLWNAITHLISQSFTIVNSDIAKINLDDTSVFFVIYNVYNQLYQRLEEAAK